MSSPSLNSYDAAFSQWKHAQERLTRTIRDYVDACAALKTALEVFPVNHASHRQRAEVFSSFDSQLAVLPSYEQTLREAQFSLRTTRNASDSLIPINSLPIEILSTILILVVQKGTNEICNLTLKSPDMPLALPAYSSRPKKCFETDLAQLEIPKSRTPACWSQIEIPIGPDDYLAYDRVDLWAKRARSQPLCLSIWERPHPLEEFNYSQDDIDYAADCLVSLLPRVHTAEFQADGLEMDDLVPEILGCWVQRGSAGIAKTLKIHIRSERNTVQLSAEHGTIKRYGPTPGYYKAFFGSLHTLVLENAKLDWKLGFYSGLVDLYLGPVSQFNPYTQWDIAVILEASPKLRSLALVDIEIRIDRNDPKVPSAIALNNLGLFRLESKESRQNLWIALQMITSTSDSIRLGLTFEDHPEFFPAAHSFLKRHKVTALYITSSHFEICPSVSSSFVRMPHLEHLAIQRWSVFSESRRDAPTCADFWPKLDNLCLINCDLDLEDLQLLLSIRAPQKLWIKEPEWDAPVRERAEEEAGRYGVKMIIVQNEQELPIWSRELVAELFVR
ncbi:hypothetical protein FRC09_009117 [Ceratobasidium sp. 395]|nr:hypothetical protein FRC09_009117 [Ceratobasidium sp. 395]